MHEGKPFTADDVVFTWEYVSDPAVAVVTSGVYKEVKRVEKVDPYTVRVVFSEPVPFWGRPFVARQGLILPRHLFDAFRGAKSREAPWNLKPVGTGPYKFVDFKPGDTVRGEINRDYHEANRPYFDAVRRGLVAPAVIDAAVSAAPDLSASRERGTGLAPAGTPHPGRALPGATSVIRIIYHFCSPL